MAKKIAVRMSHACEGFGLWGVVILTLDVGRPSLYVEPPNVVQDQKAIEAALVSQ